MTSSKVYRISYSENSEARLDSRRVFAEVARLLPKDLLTGVTILLQDSGYLTIRPIKLAKMDWCRLNRSIKTMGGAWVSNAGFSHWNIPLKELN